MLMLINIDIESVSILMVAIWGIEVLLNLMSNRKKTLFYNKCLCLHVRKNTGEEMSKITLNIYYGKTSGKLSVSTSLPLYYIYPYPIPINHYDFIMNIYTREHD